MYRPRSRSAAHLLQNALVVLGLGALAACDASSDPLAPDTDTVDVPTVITGRVSVVDASGDPSRSDASGVLVTFEGLGTSDVTGSEGVFSVEGRAEEGTIRLRLQRDDLEGLVVLSGVSPGATLDIGVSLGGGGASLTERDDDFEGDVVEYRVDGREGERALRVLLRDDDDDDDDEYVVDIFEADTRFEDDGDVTDFGSLLAALEAGSEVEVDGYGDRDEDDVFAARVIDVDVDDEDDADEFDDDHDEDSDDDHDFEGYVVEYRVEGGEGQRALRVLLRDDDDDDDDEYVVDIFEADTRFEADGDVADFGSLLAALDAGSEVEIDGYGDRDENDVFAARIVDVDVDDDDSQGNR